MNSETHFCALKKEMSIPCQPNLLNMPKVVMKEVLNNLDCPSIFRLRKVCRDLRFSIDEIKPDVHLNTVLLELPLTTSSIESYLEKVHEEKIFYLEVIKPRTGCIIRWQQKDMCFHKFARIPMEEAETLVKNPKLILDELTIDLRFSIECTSEYIEKKEEDLKKFYESLKSLLEKRSHFLKTKKIRLYVHHLSHAAEFLKCTDPESLKTILINWDSREAIEMDFSELVVLEQWKNAETLTVDWKNILTPVESFSSFKTVTLWVDLIQIKKLNEVEELFARSPKMRNFIIKSNEICERENQILSNFGQFNSYNEEFENEAYIQGRRLKQRTWTWLKNVPGSTDKYQIIVNVGDENHITFSEV